jgi:ligand-binding sensor domain-containing protein/signal transduction histidine kinase
MNRFLLSCFATIILGTSAAPVLAVTPDKAVSQYLLVEHRVAPLTSSGSVVSIRQGPRGYLWLGTPRGPLRFDGVRWVEPPPTTPAVTVLLHDASDGGRLWVGTRGAGLGVFEGGRYLPSSTSEGLTILSLLSDGDRGLWVGTTTDLRHWKPEGSERILPLTGPIVALAAEGPERVWAATTDGLARIHRDVATEEITATEVLSTQALGRPILCLLAEADGRLWIGTGNGVVLGSRSGDRTGPRAGGPDNDPIHALVRDRDGNLWAGTDGALLRWRPGEEPGTPGARPPERLPLRTGRKSPGNILTLEEDREGSLWIGTETGALFQLRDADLTPFTTTEGLADDSVRTVMQDRRGRLWIGTDGGAVHRLQPGPATGPSRPPRMERLTAIGPAAGTGVLSLLEDPRGRLWIGTADGGLLYYDERPTGAHLGALGKSEGLAHDVVTALYLSPTGTLWVGTNGGAQRLQGDQLSAPYRTEDGLASNQVRAFHETADGSLWIGTDGGLSRLQDGLLTTFTTADGLPSPFILSFYEDPSGHLWVGTNGGGLALYKDDGTFLAIGGAEGLYNDVLYQMLDDAWGNLWICSNKGIFHIPQAELAVLSDPAALASRVHSIPLQDSRNYECNGFSQPAAWRGTEGRLWFSTLRGLVQIDPVHALMPNPIAPPVVLEEVRIDGISFPIGQPAEVAPGNHRFEFTYTALSLRAAQRIRFRYHLEDWESTWEETNQRTALYTTLPSRNLRFQVLATNDSGVWNESGAEFTLHIAPPFYRTLWFYGLLPIAFLITGRGLYLLRYRQLVGRNRELEKRVAVRSSEVEQQQEELRRTNERLSRANRALRPANAELESLNREKADFLAVAAHDLRVPLVNLKGFAGEIRAGVEPLNAVARNLLPHLNAIQRRDLVHALKEDVPEALDFIDASTDRMNQLITALLALSRLGRRQLILEEIDMDDLVRETLTHLRYIIDQRRARISSSPLGAVSADLPAMKQIVENLLHNAVNYLAPERPGRIHISREDRDGEVLVHIRDNGCGIAQDQAEKVFKLLGRAGRDDIPGEGMGLAFVRSLVERHGGRIWFESTLGVGTTFSFSLPHRQPSKKSDG